MYDRGNPSQVVDPHQLESALLNLAVNSRDAMPEGGRLTIDTSNARIEERPSEEVTDLAAGEYASIVVTDTGTGMTPDVLARGVIGDDELARDLLHH